MARILVVEDDPDIVRVLAYNLGLAGHEVLTSRSGRDAIELTRREKPALVLLDLMLPDLKGAQVCQALKDDPSTGGIPVVMLTAKGEETDRIAGFEQGADDYVVKPFSVKELLLRIQAVMRRGGADVAAGRQVQFGLLRFDRGTRRAWVSDAEVELTAREFRLMSTLHANRERISTRDALLDAVWGVRAEVGPRTVDTHIQRLRDKLGKASSYIETVRGEGYRFAATPDGRAA